MRTFNLNEVLSFMEKHPTLYPSETIEEVKAAGYNVTLGEPQINHSKLVEILSGYEMKIYYQYKMRFLESNVTQLIHIK